MANFEPVRTVADLDTLDEADILAGYRDFRIGDPEPGENRGRSYWHGWRNAAIDHYQIKPDDASTQLAREYVAARRLEKKKGAA